MKTLKKKLVLNKETITHLSDTQMSAIKGGYFLSIGCECSKYNSCTRTLGKTC